MKKEYQTQKNIIELLKKDNLLTIRELQNLLKITSTSIIFHHLKQLEKYNKIQKEYIDKNRYKWVVI